ncbi:hypothetical protein KFL_000510210 [Klebsormidium nitens]|uniref:Uncharacterized protein n=1 Tax=Klebsormidium nitens TaxID=105231 RepID=A0A1Y1HNV3_KLENI|nr:hypothetical protein KFL_000510210 [Klebsormidium nitens]|eukprot:GAQ80320.1 hypothetical protein KFL_000510210 [Klebsormidium nitens]
MRVRLPETDNLEYWKPVEDKVASSLPMKKLSLDLLTSIGEDLPIWIDLRSLEGEPLPRGLSPAIGVRSGDIANFAKMALVYETGPGEEVDLREHVPNQIIVLPRSQAPKLTLEALRKKLPGRRFELLRQGQYDCLCPKWEELSEKTKQALPADMLRIKAVSDKVSKSATFLQGDDEAKARPARRRHLQVRSASLLFSYFISGQVFLLHL